MRIHADPGPAGAQGAASAALITVIVFLMTYSPRLNWLNTVG
jgi:hypothetical protein